MHRATGSKPSSSPGSPSDNSLARRLKTLFPPGDERRWVIIPESPRSSESESTHCQAGENSAGAASPLKPFELQVEAADAIITPENRDRPAPSRAKFKLNLNRNVRVPGGGGGGGVTAATITAPENPPPTRSRTNRNVRVPGLTVSSEVGGIFKGPEAQAKIQNKRLRLRDSDSDSQSADVSARGRGAKTRPPLPAGRLEGSDSESNHNGGHEDHNGLLSVDRHGRP
ncbi:hypothetical protein K439DRAFT_1641985 [Ramaria rubella]|nr:hypothetical protein K439DRAFT_1641985 [Ramaria rubella]